jgi:hypothetical protein
MASWDDVARLAAQLPGAEASTHWRRECFKVGGRAFVTRRPLSQRDREQLTTLGRAVPESELILVGVEHEGAKQALLHTEPACLTIPHLDGYPAVLVALDEAAPELLEELISESFLLAGGTLADGP